MVDRICVVLEALSVVICLHHLYGKKFKFDIVTVSFLTIEMITMQAIDYFGLPSELSMLFYLAVAGYCVIEFGFDIKKLIVNNILTAVIICVLQIIVIIIFYIFEIQQVIIGMQLLISNCIILATIVFVFPHVEKRRIYSFLQDREKVLVIALGVCLIAVYYFLIDFKKIKIFTNSDLIQYILLFSCIVLIGFMAFRLIGYKVKSKEVEIELRMHRLYADSFDNLIDNIRARQHEFDNHINTIYSQHYIFDNYEELVEAQKDYCQMIAIENKFNKLLTSGNRVIIGFLYGKFNEIDKLGINVSYRINISELVLGIPIYKLVEILGNLIGNAVDALISSKKYSNIFIRMEENNQELSIEVRNECDFINYSEIELFFTKGYSRKGKNRGLGLFHVRNICDECGLKISCQNKDIDGNNWISFIVSSKKETK